MSDVVVAGAGRTGILVSRMLAERGIGVTLVERLPAPGGQEPETDAAQLARAASRAGVRMMLGTLAAEFRQGQVHTLGVEGAVTLSADALVVATDLGRKRVPSLASQGSAVPGSCPGPRPGTSWTRVCFWAVTRW